MMLTRKSALILLLSSAKYANVLGFTVPTSLSGLSKPSALYSAVINGDLNEVIDKKAWDCDEDANCVQIDACDEEMCRTSLDVRIHGEWYDLSGE